MMQLTKEDLLNRLHRLDKDASLLYPEGDRMSVTIVGGGALVLAGFTARATLDIDIIAATKGLYQLFEKYDMNERVAAYMNSFPMNYEDRVVLLLEGNRIDFYLVALEDIVIAKLCANRPPDQKDLETVAGRINWETLEKLATDEDELGMIKMNDKDYFFFRENYNGYARRFKP